VNGSVEHDGQENITVVSTPEVEPVETENTGVVVDMEEGKLLEPLLHHDAERVEKVEHFGNVEEPKELGERRVGRIKRIGLAVWEEGVVVTVSEDTGFNSHVSTEEHLCDIVAEFEWVEDSV